MTSSEVYDYKLEGRLTENSMADELKNWEDTIEMHRSLQSQSKQLDIEFDIPPLDMDGDPRDLKRKYEEKSEEIEKWKDVIALYGMTEMLVGRSSVPSDMIKHSSIPEPDSFSDPKLAEKEYTEIRESVRRDIQKQLPEVQSEFLDKRSQLKTLIQRNYRKKKFSTNGPPVRMFSSIPEASEFSDPFDAKRAYDEKLELMKKLQTVVETTNDFRPAYSELPFDSFFHTVINTCASGSRVNKEKIENWHEVITLTQDILEFLSTANADHPSITEKEWYDSIRLAIKQEFPNVLRPIHSEINNMRDSLWEHHDFDAYSWEEFEDLIGVLYDSLGYDTRVTTRSADMGVDVWAHDDNEQVAIQVKQYGQGNPVGREALQKLSSTLAKGDADRVIVVTTSTFTRTAKEWSTEFGPEIKLINGENLIDLLSRSDVASPAM